MNYISQKEHCSYNLYRFIVRKYDPSQTVSQTDLQKIQTKYEKIKSGLVRWAIQNFGEAYFLWIHLKSVQCYVESILRFGLPADFEVILLLPKKDHESRLEKSLITSYKYLEKQFGELNNLDGDDGDETDISATQYLTEKYYPFVYQEIPTSF